MIVTLVFEKNGKFFCRKLAKIAENCDHNIDPKAAKKCFACLQDIRRNEVGGAFDENDGGVAVVTQQRRRRRQVKAVRRPRRQQQGAGRHLRPVFSKEVM
jgi:hypothetical protein